MNLKDNNFINLLCFEDHVSHSMSLDLFCLRYLNNFGSAYFTFLKLYEGRIRIIEGKYLDFGMDLDPGRKFKKFPNIPGCHIGNTFYLLFQP